MANKKVQEVDLFQMRVQIGIASSIALGTFGLLIYPATSLANMIGSCSTVSRTAVQCDASDSDSNNLTNSKTLCSTIANATSFSSPPSAISLKTYACADINSQSKLSSPSTLNGTDDGSSRHVQTVSATVPGFITNSDGMVQATGPDGQAVLITPKQAQKFQDQNAANGISTNSLSAAQVALVTAQNNHADTSLTTPTGGTQPGGTGTTSGSGSLGSGSLGSGTAAPTPDEQFAAAMARSAPNTGGTDASSGHYGKNGASSRGRADSSDSNSDQDCGTSELLIGGKVSCKATSNLISAGKITVAAGQMAGSQALNVMGQTSQQNLMATGATQAQVYQDAAELQKKAAMSNIALGSAQMMMGYLDNKRANFHGTQASSIRTGLTGNNQFSDDEIKKGVDKSGNPIMGISRGTNQELQDAQANVQRTFSPEVAGLSNVSAARAGAVNQFNQAANRVGAKGYTEQNLMKDQAKSAGFTNMLQSGQAMLSGAMSIMQANQLEKLYASMANPTAQPSGAGADTFSTLGSNGTGGTITGNGTSSSSGAQAATASPTPGASSPFGAPIGGPLNNSLAGVAPAIQPGGGAAPPAANGGGGAAGGSVGTSPSNDQAQADPTAKYAPQVSSPGYQSQGFAAAGGGPKNGNPDNSINPKDLMADMMAQMLGKKDETNGQGILAYGGDRLPASEAPFAPLPKNEEMFGYIHKAYQTLQVKKRIGG